MRDTSHLTWVRERMPDESAKALMKFLERNPAWAGAGWDDCLDAMMDSDAHLAITEPIHELMQTDEQPHLITAVAITLLYSDRAFALDFTNEMRAFAVAATISLKSNRA